MRATRIGLSLVTALLMLTARAAVAQTAAPPPAPAPEAPPTAPTADDGLRLHGFASASYIFNFNQPPSATNGFRVFDFTQNALRLDAAELVVEKTVSSPHDVGFRADVVVGSSIPRVSAAAGLFRDPNTGKAHDYDLQQAYASYMVSHHVRVEAGKFVTPLGLEVIEGWDGYNDNASRSFLFGYAIPFTHTGLRVTATAKRVSGLVMVVNGWDNLKDNNTGKTMAGQLTLAPSDVLSFVVTAITGPEQPLNNHDLRTVYDFVWKWKVTSVTSLGLSADDGHESGAAPGGGTAVWRGVAGYSRIGLSKTLALCLRGEVFDDPQGVRTGMAQQLTEVTVTPEVRLSPHALVRADIRVDRSNRFVFDARSGATATQPTIQFNFLCFF
jgi:Putative beta-barrel porin-2, OmpL-like. bbp2